MSTECRSRAREWGRIKTQEESIGKMGLNDLVNLHKGWTNTDEWYDELIL